MKKFYLFIFLLFTLSILVSARVLQISESENQEIDAARTDGDVSHCEKIESRDGKDVCYEIIVGNSKNPDSSLCDKISSQENKNSCYNSASYTNKDPSLCEKILESPFMNDLCYTNAAIAKKDVSFCYKIIESDQKDFCYEKIAISNEDSSLCDDITNGRYRDSCFSSLGKKDPKLPDYESDSGNKKEGIFTRIFSFFRNLFGKNEPNIPECSKNNLVSELSQEEREYYGKSNTYLKSLQTNCYISYAIREKDISICYDLGSPTKESCILEVAIATNDSSLCIELKDPRYSDECFNKIAIATGDYTLCEKIERYTDKKNLCFTDVAKGKKDLEICNKIEEKGSSFYKDQCRYLVSIGTEDTSLCKNLGNLEDRNNCYINIAKSTKDLSVCDNVSIEGGDKELSIRYCYTKVFENGDVSICNSLEGERKEFCIGEFS